jgi:hypothetical protein
MSTLIRKTEEEEYKFQTESILMPKKVDYSKSCPKHDNLNSVDMN